MISDDSMRKGYDNLVRFATAQNRLNLQTSTLAHYTKPVFRAKSDKTCQRSQRILRVLDIMEEVQSEAELIERLKEAFPEILG